MRTRGRKVCGTIGCPNPTDSAHCATHAPKPWTKSAERQTSTKPLSMKEKRFIRRRDKSQCRRCNEYAHQVDHIVPTAQGGTNSRGNLQLLCDACHTEKTTRERIAARWPKGPQ